ncbi:hypothetical protein L6452_22829 [Arctium lappa]|uniref:Uncharacterized protein n=1 Tax=Arctium lappa TaxID=4217 RepID=A0ACB9B258_ARCLA|nr:hypothetical protein L6452_22829 [Arctium lappa]
MKNRWTVLVQVVDPGHMQTSKVASNFRRLLLTDSHLAAHCSNTHSSKVHTFCRIGKTCGKEITSEKRPMILTLWDYFADTEGQILENLIDPQAMVFGLRLKVSSFNGLSLTIRNGSSILINPPVSEDLQ